MLLLIGQYTDKYSIALLKKTDTRSLPNLILESVAFQVNQSKKPLLTKSKIDRRNYRKHFEAQSCENRRHWPSWIFNGQKLFELSKQPHYPAKAPFSPALANLPEPPSDIENNPHTLAHVPTEAD